MENKIDKDTYATVIGGDVGLISFLTVISVFFLGVLLPQFNSYDVSIKIPISFLIISTFGFLFSALILANSSQKVINNEFGKMEKHFLWGYTISEYLGVYLFVVSLPLLVNIITTDFYLRMVTLCAAVLGLTFYQLMGFSLLSDHFAKKYKLFSVIIILFIVILFFSQIYHFYFTIAAIIFIIFILSITCLAPIKSFQ